MATFLSRAVAALLLLLQFGTVWSLPLDISLGGNAGSSRGSHWVDIWTTMPQLVEPYNLPPAPYVSLS
jgi:hypothetical protein